MMSEITKKAPRTETPDEAHARPQAAPSRATGGFWSFMKTLFVGTAGLALLAVIGTLAGSAWLTANQRAEAEKAAPWSAPSFTTTAVTTGGLLARWMDNDSDLGNGHSYVKGIYEIWKTRYGQQWDIISVSQPQMARLPLLWQAEFNNDAAARNRTIELEADRYKEKNRSTVEKSKGIKLFEPD